VALLQAASDSYAQWEELPPLERINQVAAATNQTSLATDLQLQGNFLKDIAKGAANATLLALPAAPLLYEAIVTGDPTRLSAALALYASVAGVPAVVQWVSRYITNKPEAKARIDEQLRQHLNDPASAPKYYDGMSETLKQIGLTQLASAYSTAADKLGDLQTRIEEGGGPASFAAGLVILTLSSAMGARLNNVAEQLVQSSAGALAPFLSGAGLEAFAAQYRQMAVGAASASLDLVGLTAIRSSLLSRAPQWMRDKLGSRVGSAALLLLWNVFGKKRLNEGVEWLRGFVPEITTEETAQIIDAVNSEMTNKEQPPQFWVQQPVATETTSPARIAMPEFRQPVVEAPAVAAAASQLLENPFVTDAVSTLAQAPPQSIATSVYSNAFQSAQSAQMTAKLVDQFGGDITPAEASAVSAVSGITPVQSEVIGSAAKQAQPLEHGIMWQGARLGLYGAVYIAALGVFAVTGVPIHGSVLGLFGGGVA
jgi:hypothetical protein